MSLDVVSTWLFMLLYEPFSVLSAVTLCFGIAIGLYSLVSGVFRNKSDQRGGDA